MQGTLYVVATPIGNLDDLSPRVVRVLGEVDLIAAEDTRHSGRLLMHYGIKTRTISLHDHNEKQIAISLIEKMLAGRSIALISDAGTPLVSDPGYSLVDAAHSADIRVVPIAGPSSITAALSVAGLPTDRFVFEGFLPAKSTARRQTLERLKNETRTLVFLEAPHRIEKTLNAMVEIFGADRQAAIAREMTKRFEQVVRGDVAKLSRQLHENLIPQKGEFVLIVRGCAEQQPLVEAAGLIEALCAELPPSRAALIAHKLTGISRKLLYEQALSLGKECS